MQKRVYLTGSLRLLLAISLIASMFPSPARAAPAQPAAPRQTVSTSREVETLAESLDPLLPTSLATAVTEFSANGFLLNSDLTASSPTGVDWLDNPLTVGRVQSAYRAADAIDATLVVTVTVHNNRPPSSFVQLPAGATITDTLALFADVDLTDDPNTIRNVILTNQLADGISLLAATPLADGRNTEHVWNLGDIPPLGQAEVVLRLEIPGAVTDFIDLDTGAAAWGTLQGRAVSGQAWPAALAPDMLDGEPLDRWLKRTLDADTHDPYLLAQAARLGQDPARLFAYVRSLGYEAYAGSLRGTRGTLWSEAGNAVDQSSLLIALLRASGIPARYAHGTLSQAHTEDLILSMFPTPTRYIGHVPAELDVSEPTADPQILAEAGDHWWVQAYLNGQWLDLDPSFPQAQPGEVFAETLLETTDELPDALRHRVTVQVEVETYNSFLFGLQRTIQLDHTFRSVELAGNPVTLGHLVDTNVQVGLISYYEQRTYTPYLLLDDEIVEGTPFDEIMSSLFGALINRNVTAEWLLFTLQHPDGSTQSYRREIADLIGFEKRQTGGHIQFEFESGNTPTFLNDQSSYTSLVGATTVPESVIPAFYPQVVAALAEMHETNEAAQAALNSDAPESEKLAQLRRAQLAFSQVARLSQQMHLLTFAAASDFGSRQLGNAFLVKPYFDSPRILITSWEWDEANDVRRVYFDLHRDDIRTVAYPGQAWEGLMAFNYARGLQEIALESTLLEEMAGEAAISVHAVFREAKLAGIPLVALTAIDREELARLDLSAEAKARISETLQEEQNTVIVPSQMVTINGQTTVGWIVIDEINGRTVDMMENGQRLAALEYSLILVSDWHKLNFALIGFMHGFAAYSLAFVGSLLGNLNSGASIKDIWAKSLEEATALVNEIVQTIDAGAHFLGNCTFIPGNPTNDWVKAYLHGTGYGVNITIGFKLKLGFAGDVAKCLGIPTGHSETIYEKTFTGGGFLNGATAAEMYMRSQIDPPLPGLLMARWPGEAPGLAQATQTIPVAATLSGSQVNATVDTELLAAAGTLDFNWNQNDTWSNALAFTTLTAATASLYDEGGTLLGSGSLVAEPQSDSRPATAFVSGAEVSLVADGTAAFYAPALTGLAAGSEWSDYTAQLNAAAPYTIELANALVSLDETAVYSGRLTAVIDGTGTVSGAGLTAVPNFAPDINASAGPAHLMVAPVEGSITVGGQNVAAGNGFALANYAGSLALSELDAATDRAALDGDAQFFSLNLAPADSTTAGTTPVAFQAVIPANFNDSYTMTVTGPVGWQIEVDAGGGISAVPPLGAAAGDYPLQVVVQSHAYPGLFVSAVHTVTLLDSEGVALEVVNDPLITVPWGPAADNAVPGSTNSGRLQLTGAAFTIDITNTSSIAHIFDLSVSGLAADWVILSGATGQTATSISLPAGGVGQLGLYISPTLSLPAAGTPYAFNVTATAVANPTLSQGAPATFIVPAIAFSHMVVAPDIVHAAPNSTAGFDLALRNVGNVAGDFPLTLILPDGDWTDLSNLENPVTVAAGATVTQVVTLSLPEATLGQTYQVMVESPIPDIQEYIQKAVVAVVVVSPQTEALYGLAADMEELFPDNVSLPAALQALGLAVTDLEASCATGTCALDLRDRVVAALISLADQVAVLAPQGETAETLRQLAADMAAATEAAELLAGTAAIGQATNTLQTELEAVARHNLQAWLAPGLVAILDDGSTPAAYTLRLTNHGRLETTAVMTLTAPAHASSDWTNLTTVLQPGAVVTIPITLNSTVQGLDSLQVDIIAAESSLISHQVQASLNVVDAFVRVTQVIADPAFVETGTSATDLSVVVANVANVYRPAVAHTSILTPDGSLIWSESTPIEVRTGAPRVHALGTVDTSGWAVGIYTVTVELVDGGGNFIPDGRGIGFLAAGQVIEAHHAVIPALVVPGNVTVTTVITTQMRPDLPQPSSGGANQNLTLSNDEPEIAGGSGEHAEIEETAVESQVVPPTEAGHDTASSTEPATVNLAASPSSLEIPGNFLLEEGETGIIRYEEDHPALVFEPEWTRTSYNWASGGFSSYHDVAGSSASLTFEGTWLGLGFTTRTNSGLAEIFIDGESRGIVDTYSRFDSTLSLYYDDLVPGSHTVTIVVLGDRNPNSTANFVRLDYIDVWDGSAMVEGTFEQDSDRVHLSSNWTTVNNALASGGSFIRSGSSAWFPFTGDSVTFQAFAYSSGGQIEIFIDGQWQGRFDLYNASNTLRTFSINNLGAGPHVLQVRAYRSNATVDAFITPGSPPFYEPPEPAGITRYEEDHPDVWYNGVPFMQTSSSWISTAYNWASQGHSIYSSTAGDTVSLTFTGTWLSLGFVTRSNAGLAEIFIDGVSRGIVDTYSRLDGTVSVYYDDLASGSHTVTINVLGSRSPNSSGDFVRLDYIDVWNGDAMPDGTFEATTDYEKNSRLHRSTNWSQIDSTIASEGSYIRGGSNIWFPFTGDSVTFQALAYSGGGQVEIFVDGRWQGRFDLYNATTITRTFSFGNLGPGPHVLQVSNYRGTATVDNFTTPGSPPFYQPPAPTGIVRYEEDHPTLLYNGVPFTQTATSWVMATATHGSGGYMTYSQTAGDTVSLTFEGTWVGVGLLTFTNAGMAEIFIDGESRGVVDTYSRTANEIALYYDDLEPGSHTLTIVVLGSRNPNSTNDRVFLDYIDAWQGDSMPDGTFEAVTTFEENPRLHQSTNWSQINHVNASEGSYIRGGSTVWFPFTGDSVTFQAFAYSGAGEVEIYIDGQWQARVDLYNATTITRTFSFGDLGPGPHVLQVASYRGTATVDNFTTPGSQPFYEPPARTGVIRYEEDHPSLLYNDVPIEQTSPSWVTLSAARASRGYVYYSQTANDTVTLDFEGTWIGIGFLTASNAGMAEIFIDGQSRGVVDTYNRTAWSTAVYYDDLNPSSHTLTIQVLSTRNPNSSANRVHLDYIDVWDGTSMPDGTFEATTVYEENPRLHQSTNWSQFNNAAASEGSYIRGGSSVWFPFSGDSVTFQAFAYSGAGEVEIYIDGQWQARVDLYNATNDVRTFSFGDLGPGPHMLEVSIYRGTATVDNFTTPGSQPFYEPPAHTGILRYEEDHPALLYNDVPIRQTSTSWVTLSAVRASRGYVYYSQTANDAVTLDFEGTWIGIGFLTASNAGMAEIFIDGESRGVVDTYNSSARTLSLYYDDLAPGSHTLTIHVLGTRNPNSSANRVHLDYIDVWDGTSMPDGTFEATTAYEENPWLHQSTNWSQINHATASEGSYIRAGSNVWFPFTGDSVTFQAFGYSGAGQVEILVDGQQHGVLNLTSSTVVTHSVSAFDLGPGPHVLQIQAFQGTATVDNFTTPGRLPLVDMTPPVAEIPIQSGDSLTYTLLLANKGTRTDTFDLALAGNTWPASLSTAAVTLAPGMSTEVAVLLSVPAGTPVGSSDTVTITAVSTVYPEQTAVSTLTTRVVNLRVQLCLALDGSGSISGSEWLIMTGGIANAVRDSSIMPWNGSVELSIVQFGSSQARTELAPVIILGEATAQSVADQIEAIPQIGGNTPMAAGVDQCTALITGSPYFTAANKRVINVPNDGEPNVGSPNGRTAAVNARIAAVEAGIHEVNAEGIGITSSNFAWLRDEFVYPQPGYEAPPFIPGRGGFAVYVNSFAEFEESIREKVRFVTHVSYGLEVDHRVPLANAVVLTNTITPAPAVTGIDGDETLVGWQYVLTEDEPEQIHNLQLQLEDMEPGEVRQVASGTWVSYTVAGGSNLLALPPLYVTAAHLVAIEPPLQTVSLGSSTVYQVELFNPGTADLDLDLSLVGLPAGWADLAGSATVPAAGSLTLPLTITTPTTGELGDYPFAVVVTTGSGGRDQAGAVLRVDSPAEQFAISVAPKYAAVPNGATITYTVTITNLEPADQSYALTWTGLTDSVVELPPSVSVAAGGAVSVPLVVIAAGSHGPHPFAVTATSLGSGTARSDDAVMAVIGDRRVAASLAPPVAVGGPGTETPYTLTVTNTGSVFDTYDISAGLPDGWSYRLDANGLEVNSLALNAFLFNAADLRLLVTPADDALPGDYNFTITVQSQINPNVRATTGGVLTVLPYGVRVQLQPSELIMSPADTGSWQVTVTNTGSVADTYDLSASGIIQAVAQFSPATVSLAPGQSQTIQMNAGGMTFALPTSYAIGVTAQSQSDGRIQASDDSLLIFTGYEAVEARWHPASQTISGTLSASYMLVITNTGNVGTVFDVAVAAPDLTVAQQVEQLYIPARMVAGVLVTVAATEAGTYAIHGSVTAVSGAATADDTAILVVQLANQPPAVDAGPDQTTDEGTAISFAGTVTHPDNLDFTVAWDFGDGNGAGNVLTPTHTYLDDGLYLVTLTATDSNGLSSSDTLTVTVNNVAPLVDAGPDQTVDVGEMVNFSGSFTDPGVLDTYEIVWDFGDGQIAEDSLTVSHVYEMAGVYTVTLTVTDNAGDAGSDTLLVTVLAETNNPPVAVDDEATAVQETPLVIDVLANDYDPDGDELTIIAVTQPANGTVVINDGETVTYTPAAGFYGTTDSFTYTISDGRGGTDTATVVVTVVPAGVCTELYPIALHIDTLLAVNIGDVIQDIYNGGESGQFGWLSWTGDPSVGALVTSLTPPGNSYAYVNPYDPDDDAVSTGDWVFGAPGVSNSGNVRQALDNLKTVDITVPVWDASAMSGNNTLYHVAGFAVVRLIDYHLPNQNRISVHFKGFAANCGDLLVPESGQSSRAEEISMLLQPAWIDFSFDWPALTSRPEGS